MQLKIPVTVMLAGGGSWLPGETVTVSKFGARVRLRSAERKLACGDSVAVSIERARRSCAGRIVWLDSRNGPQVGIEIQDPSGFWGVYFPGNDEAEAPPCEPLAAKAPASVAIPAPLPAPMTQAIPPRRPVVTVLDEREMVGVVSGVSALYSGFTERAVFSVATPDEVTGMLATPLNLGARVRIVANSAMFYGRVLTVSAQRTDGKWPVRLKIVQSSLDAMAN